LLPSRGDKRRLHVGLLGGSFNPAHAGHLQVARLALTRLRLDQVWLLVSPGNPLKPRAGMAPLGARLDSARAIADGRRIVATDIERQLRTRYTIDTLLRLQRLFPNVRFVWLMGADGLAELPRWRRWRDIVRAVPIAVLPRPGYNHRALAGQAARRLVHARRPGGAAPILADSPPPAWMFLTAPQTDISATALRQAARGTWPEGRSSR
jgi:nicotinate-nucleotide adenylyltransferase